ncbi:hypothetical protein EDB86DRAFT_3079463 [Lactarius hatsudake]|nr:hypothetical protein EDB86DRAFT_3079463 [Lactarius hatsudake]
MHPGTKHIALVLLCLLVKHGCTVLPRSGVPPPKDPYRLSDWYIHFFSPAPMSIERTKHHRLSSADAECAVFLPNNGTLYFGPPGDLAIANWFFEQRCLEVIRREIIDAFPQEESRLCVNLIKENLLCRADAVADSGLVRKLKFETNQSQGNE